MTLPTHHPYFFTVRHDIKFGEHGSENPRQGSPLRERWEELAHEFSRMMNVYNL